MLLSEFARQNRSIVLWCAGCKRGSDALLPAELLRRHGDLALEEFLARSVCARCGARVDPDSVRYLPIDQGSMHAGA